MDFKTFNKKRDLPNDEQYIHFFGNGYGVSIIRNKFSYGSYKGQWEIMPLKGTDFENSELLQDEGVGRLEEKDVNEICEEISKR